MDLWLTLYVVTSPLWFFAGYVTGVRIIPRLVDRGLFPVPRRGR